MHQSQHQRGPTPDGFSHNPVTSSDEALSEMSDGVSDVSVPPSKDLTASAVALTAATERGRRSLRSLPRPELGVDKSNISSTTFVTAGSNSASPSGQFQKRSYQTMKGESVDEDDRMESWTSKKTKTKTMYGHINNKRVTPAASQEDSGEVAKESFPAGGRKLHAQGNPTLLSPTSEGVRTEVSKAGAFKVPPTIGTPRAKRASQRLSRNGQAGSQAESTNGFKVPMKVPSPKKTKQPGDSMPNFKVPPVLPTHAGPVRITRSTQSFKKPESLLTDDLRGNGGIINVVEPTRATFDPPNLHSAIPSSSMTASSRRSTSNDRASPLSSSISSPPSSPELDASFQEISLLTFKPPVSRHVTIINKCPYCKDRVDRDFLLDFDSTVRLSVREQSRFCKAHRIRSAEVEWKEKGYPIIDWPRFDKRLNKFHGHLNDIMENQRDSFYRNAYEERFKSRQNETAKQSMMTGDGLENLELGYYGSRGAKHILQNIITRFTTKLRRLSAKDKLISSNSVSRYVQAVLAPELAIMLVKEDMGVDDEGARALLRDSAALGNLLNEEEDEEIRDEETPNEETEEMRP